MIYFLNQADEIQALASILGDDFVPDKENSFTIRIRNSLGNEVSLQVSSVQWAITMIFQFYVRQCMHNLQCKRNKSSPKAGMK